MDFPPKYTSSIILATVLQSFLIMTAFFNSSGRTLHTFMSRFFRSSEDFNLENPGTKCLLVSALSHNKSSSIQQLDVLSGEFYSSGAWCVYFYRYLVGEAFGGAIKQFFAEFLYLAQGFGQLAIGKVWVKLFVALDEVLRLHIVLKSASSLTHEKNTAFKTIASTDDGHPGKISFGQKPHRLFRDERIFSPRWFHNRCKRYDHLNALFGILEKPIIFVVSWYDG